MLPRVNLVLKKFLSPIGGLGQSSSAFQNKAGDKSEQDRNRNLKESPQTKAPLQEASSPAPLTTPPQKASLKLVEPTQEAPPPRIGDTPTILQLFTLLRGQKGNVMRWLGLVSYRKSGKDKNKRGKFKKGAMLDHKIE